LKANGATDPSISDIEITNAELFLTTYKVPEEHMNNIKASASKTGFLDIRTI
jgi:hypothetical protein